MAIHINDLVVASDPMVTRALEVDFETVFIVVRGPYEAQHDYVIGKKFKQINICVDIMGNGRIFESIPCGWLIRAKSKRSSGNS